MQIGKDIRIQASEYKGKWYVGIRKWYQEGEEWKPGRQGINLKLEEWNELKDNFDEIVQEIESAVNES